MSIQRTDFFHAAGSFGQLAPGVWTMLAGQGFKGITATAVGDFTVELDQAIDILGIAPLACNVGLNPAVSRSIAVDVVDDTHLRVTVRDAAGVLTDAGVALAILRFGN